MAMRAAFVLLCAVMTKIKAQDDCIYQPGQLNTQILEEFGCALLDCQNITTNSSEYIFDGWILPDVTYIGANFNNEKITVDELAWTIEVRNITREDTGYYHCMLIYQGEYYLVRMGLNIKGPFFISGWEEYKDNTAIGLAAFAGFLVLTALCYLIYYFRYQSDEDDSSDFGKTTIDGFAAESSNVVAAQRIVSLPGYTPYQDQVKSIGDHSETEVRKRVPVVMTTQDNVIGHDNPAFQRGDSVVSDVMVDEFFGKNGVETTEL